MLIGQFRSYRQRRVLNAPTQINDASIMRFRANSWLLNWNCLSLYRVDTRRTILWLFWNNQDRHGRTLNLFTYFGPQAYRPCRQERAARGRIYVPSPSVPMFVVPVLTPSPEHFRILPRPYPIPTVVIPDPYLLRRSSYPSPSPYVLNFFFFHCRSFSSITITYTIIARPLIDETLCSLRKLKNILSCSPISARSIGENAIVLEIRQQTRGEYCSRGIINQSINLYLFL